jgi:Zn-dependent M16 (insulinase) family peptidase
MGKAVDPNNKGLKVGANVFGFLIKRIVHLAETRSFFYELEHTSTGARHIHISSNDGENTFAVALRTVPKDSTGVAHILEHTVLCGSNQFPVRDPFFSMLKRSLSTFMNAFTASDWTMYPFSTQNKKDFYNLMDVYLDAVFYPIIDELSFKQEGHRLEIEGDPGNIESSRLVYKGIVYNEMKGAMSSPDQVMARSLLKALYPSTTYRNNSGGDPVVIPNLTYAQLKAFHKRYYHPSNTFFYTYGNLPLKDHLSFIGDKIRKRFVRINPDSIVSAQPRWNKPQTVNYSYPLGKNQDPSKKYQVCVAWLTADIKDTFEVLVLILLEQILLGNSASPLRKALIDSQLGAALCDTAGFEADNRDTLFACGLKDVEKSTAEKIETIIFDVLRDLVSKGIDNKLIESAIHQVEFHRKEVTNTPYPYGIKQLLIMAGSWLHGGDPIKKLQLENDLKKLRNFLSQGPFFEGRIEKYFLDNPHRVLFTLVPDQAMEQKERERVEAELEDIRTGMSPLDLAKLVQDAESLNKLQEATEDLSCLPTLTRDDIPVSIQKVIESTAIGKAPALCFNQPTSGIFYFTAAAGIGLLPKNLIPLVSFFCFALPKIGTVIRNYADMAQRIDLYTGGINLSTHARTGFDGNGVCVPYISSDGKCLARNQTLMFEIIAELFFKFDFSDLIRLKNLLLEYRAGLETMIIHTGHRLAISLAARNFSTARSLGETWSGVHQLKRIKAITDDLTNDKLKSLATDLATIAQKLFSRHNVKIALIGEEKALNDAVAPTISIQKDIDGAPGSSKTPDAFEPPNIDLSDEIPREGWSTASAVSFVAQAFETVRMEHEDAPALAVISKVLRSMYLHREIREKGGAYGGFAIYNPEDGLFCQASYRDPHIVSTLNVFKNAAKFIRSGAFGDEDINEAILQVCSEIDKPDPPGPAARKAFYRKIISLSDEARQSFKERLLALTRLQVLRAAKKYFDQDPKKHAVAVISGEEQLKSANKKLPQNPLELYRI